MIKILNKIKKKNIKQIFQAIIKRLEIIRFKCSSFSGRIKSHIKNIIDFTFPFIRNEYYKQHDTEIINKISQSVSIISPIKTLKEVEFAIINHKKGAYMRFGDGDSFLAVGKDDQLQASSIEISEDMGEAFSLNGEYVFKSLSIHSMLYGYEKEMFLGNHLVTDEVATRLLSMSFPFFVGHKIYSPIFLHYVATYQPDRANSFLKLLKQNCKLFIGNEATTHEKVELLFGNVPHVKTPSKNAFDAIDGIENEAIKELEYMQNFGVVVVAMGCSGRILMKRLYKRGYNIFFFDFGSLLDGICGNKTRTWLKRSDIDYVKLLNGL